MSNITDKLIDAVRDDDACEIEKIISSRKFNENGMRKYYLRSACKTAAFFNHEKAFNFLYPIIKNEVLPKQILTSIVRNDNTDLFLKIKKDYLADMDVQELIITSVCKKNQGKMLKLLLDEYGGLNHFPSYFPNALQIALFEDSPTHAQIIMKHYQKVFPSLPSDFKSDSASSLVGLLVMSINANKQAMFNEFIDYVSLDDVKNYDSIRLTKNDKINKALLKLISIKEKENLSSNISPIDQSNKYLSTKRKKF